MKKRINRIQFFQLFVVSFLIVGVGIIVFHFLNKPPLLTIDEALWVKRGNIVYPPGSSASQEIIDRLHPDYIDFDSMTFTSPVLYLDHGLTESSYSRKPLLITPYHPQVKRSD